MGRTRFSKLNCYKAVYTITGLDKADAVKYEREGYQILQVWEKGGEITYHEVSFNQEPVYSRFIHKKKGE